MSSIVDNVMLALISLRKELQTYLNENNWKNRYTLFIAGDPDYVDKEVVRKVTDKKRQIELPIITIESGNIRNEIRELGDGSGTDVITITFFVSATDQAQLITLANLIRRKVHDMTFTIYDYRGSNEVSVGTGLLDNAVLDDISNWNSDSLFERHVSLINTTLELPAESFV